MNKSYDVGNLPNMAFESRFRTLLRGRSQVSSIRLLRLAPKLEEVSGTHGLHDKQSKPDTDTARLNDKQAARCTHHYCAFFSNSIEFLLPA